jgi:cytochrome bd-type quinol oxidase subunit 2
LALTAYAVLAGADFGGGVWDFFASGPRAADQRRAVAEAMGPVWEANHVWLIFLIVGLYTAFPSAFGILSLALYLPLTIALVGIVLRGASFAFRAHGSEAIAGASPWGVAFGVASTIACLTLTPIAAPPLARALFGRGLPLLILALINGPIALVAVWLSRPQIARVAVVAQVVFVLWAWAVGQWPYLIPPDITIQGAAAPAATLTGMLVVIGVGMLFLLPSLGLLFYVFKARNPGAVKQPQ